MKSNSNEALKETTVFGETVKKYEHHHGPNVVTGVILVLAGLILLANNAGILPSSIWMVMGQYWPLFFILWGVQIIIGKSWVASIVMTIISLVVIGGVVIIGIKETNPGLIYQVGLDKLPGINNLNNIHLQY